MRSLLLFLYLCLVSSKGAGALDPNLPFMEYLDQNHLVCLKWGFDDLQGTITFKFVVNTTGWVGFGFSPNGGMQGADIVMGGLGSSGSYFKDYHATGNTMPLEDMEQSYTLLSLSESDGQTSMTFQRAIVSCDQQDFQITAQPIKLIYAYGTTDAIRYHGARRGTKEVNLLNYMARTTLTNVNFLSATVDNITVPATHTYYHCKLMNFPRLITKHHIIVVEPVIENADMVHHMLLYRCPSYVTQPYDSPCFQGDMQELCMGVVATWGVGGGVMDLPENVGIPVGGEDSDTFYRLEIHYNNPNNESGRTDSSGLRLYYTAQLRQHDAGILMTGVMPGGHMMYKIPPKATQFRTYGVCNTTLISQLLDPMPDLQVFAVLMHTHLAGRKVRVGHFTRNGTQIDFLGLDENYDFDLQQLTNMGVIKTIKQGDEIAVECTYSTASRTAVTTMGLGTMNEMCLAFLYYYPAINITTCQSHPNTMHPLMNTSYQMFEGTTAPDQDEIAAYERLLKTVPQLQFVSDDSSNFSGYADGMVREMMKTPTVTCKTPNASSRLVTSWIVNPAGVILLLLWIAII
ncbi:DBH-like monooxygenase protein 2 homolog [Pagrus major]|uniref:DBH-like monooxygenase protein 2 homolog n=1 Tax=Pagrus major TaxID=143350 RepID=UPI003CC8D8A0